MTNEWPGRSAKRMRWSDEEEVFVKEAAKRLFKGELIAPGDEVDVIRPFLPGRSWEAVRSKLYRERRKLIKEVR